MGLHDTHDTSQTELTAMALEMQNWATNCFSVKDYAGGTAILSRWAERLRTIAARRAVERGGEGRGCTEPAEADDRASQTASGGSAAAVRTPTPPSMTEGLEVALQKARDQFAFYYEQHMAKSPPDVEKARVNGDFANMCDLALAAARQASVEKGAK